LVNQLSNLRWGTPASNSADQKRDGTVNQGERNGAAKLTADSVRGIRELISSGVSDREIAKLFNVHKMQVSRIRRGKTWAQTD
jgi:DNA invertase Pin-like site-specific DNA recombinase